MSAAVPRTWSRAHAGLVALLLAGLGVAVLAAPDAVPWLMVSGEMSG